MAMVKNKQLDEWVGTLSLGSIGTSLFTAFFVFLLEIIFVISFTALVYSGELASQIPRAIGFVILGDAILCGIGAAFSSNPGALALEQDAPGAMLSVVAVSIAAALSGSTARQFATVTMMVVLTSIATGLILLALGFFKLGGLVRFLPYPVIGGFLAGTGWLLIQGGINLMVNTQIGPEWLLPAALTLWLPGAALGVAIHYLTKKINKPYTIPLLMLAASLLFYGVTWLLGTSLDQLRAGGWLLDAMVSGETFQSPFTPDIISQVDWGVLLQQAPALAPVAIISVIGLLLNSSGMELVIKKDLDLNRELVVAGLGNLLSGLAGGLTGFQDISFSSLNHSMTGGKRLVGVASAVFLAATIFVGTSAVLYIPKFIFGSVLIYLGIELLREWVYDAWFSFPRTDFLVIVTILLVVVFSGFLQGIVAGLVLAIMLFAVSYSRVKVVRFTLTGREYHSRVTRGLPQQKLLEKYGNQIHILKLEGFIFFGTANGIFSALKERMRTPEGQAVKYILIDFAKVTGIDSTGMLSFARMLQWSRELGVTLILTGLTGKMKEQFINESANLEQGKRIEFFDDLDHGLEWCENLIVAQNPASTPLGPTLATQLSAIIRTAEIEKLIPYLERREYQPGEYLVHEGDPGDLMYFIESGQVTAQLETVGKKSIRLETMYGGRTVGELGFYLSTRRSASVITNQPSVIYSLSSESLQQLESEDPETASLFHRMMVLLLSERVAHLSRTVGALERA